MKAFSIALVILCMASCSRDIRDEQISSENIHDIVPAIATSTLSETEKRNLLAYYEEWMITGGVVPGSIPQYPDITIRTILDQQKDRNIMQESHLASLDKLGKSFFTTGGEIGETMSFAAFAAMPLTSHPRPQRTLRAQRSADFVLANFKELYNRLPPLPDAVTTDTLTRAIRLANGTIMETP